MRIFPKYFILGNFPYLYRDIFLFKSEAIKERPGGSFGRNETKCSDWKKWVGLIDDFRRKIKGNWS